MNKKRLTDEQRKENKANCNKRYYGTLAHAESMLKYWKTKVEELKKEKTEK